MPAAAMAPADSRRCWLRRARPLLGTLVEIGLAASPDAASDGAAFGSAFDAIVQAQRVLSRFEADSDVDRFHALDRLASMPVRPAMRDVLVAAQDLQHATGGDFDISVGTAPDGWRFDGERLHKLSDAVRFDLGGIGKGHAVDLAVAAMRRSGCRAGWVNAGGDLRAFGEVTVPVNLRDEASGGVRPFGTVRDGAFATSCFDAGSRSWLAHRLSHRPLPGDRAHGHVSVAAPRCLIADALTKVVALRGEVAMRPLLARHGATAWVHGAVTVPEATVAA